jgi:hypothetical protein
VGNRFYEIGSAMGIRDLEKYLAKKGGNSSEAARKLTIK